MSYKVVDRVLHTSVATGADRLALVAIGHLGREDGVLADSRVDHPTLAELAGVHVVTLKDALVSLCEAEELVYLRGVGRGRTSIYGVLCGLDAEAAEAVYEKA